MLIMGLRGRGKLHAFQRRAIELRDNETRRLVACLLELGCDLGQAAEAMERKMARERRRLETAGCDSVSAASIADLWNRTPDDARIPWLAAARCNLLNRTFPLAEFLASFPPDSLPDSLKSLL